MMWSGIVIFVIALLAAWLVPMVSDYLAADRCLDTGGSYDRQTHSCALPSAAKRPDQ